MNRILLTILGCILSTITFALNFTVYPVRFDVDSAKVSTREVILVNNTLEPLRIEAYPRSDEEFGKDYNLNNNIVLFPKVISIKPGGTQVVRFRVKPDKKFQNGEYKSYLTFKEQPSEIKTTSKEQEGGVSSNIQFITQISVPVYSLGKNQIIDGKLTNIECVANGSTISLKGKSFSNGNTSLNFNYTLDIVGTTEEFNGKFANSARVGEKDLSLVIQTKDNLKGKRAKLKIADQTGKVHFNDEIIIK